MKPFINKIDKISGILSFDALSNYVAKYSINAILTDSDRKTLWIDGYPYGYGFYQKKTVSSSIVPTGPDNQTYWNSIVLNDYGTDTRYGNIAIGNYSLSSGSLTRAIGNYSVAEGYETWAVGDHSHAEGILSIALAASSHAEGYSNTGEFAALSHAENISTTLGQLSHAEGYLSTANGNISHAEGEHTIAYAWGSHAEGYGTKTGNVPMDIPDIPVIPDITTYIKDYLSTNNTFNLNNTITFTATYVVFTDDENTPSTSVIYTLNDIPVNDIVATPQINFASPTSTENPIDAYSGYYSHAEGVTTIAGAMGSHSEGFGSETKYTALFSHAEGIETITTNYGEHAEGKYNISIRRDITASPHISGTIHTIGIGTATNVRKNAVRVDNDGAVYLAAIKKNDDEYYNPCGYFGTETDPGENEISVQKILSTSHIKWVSETYNNIKNLIDAKSLIPGAFYRITDYNTVVNSSDYEQNYVSSDMNPFDVIVLAISESELSETAWAVRTDNTDDTGLGDETETIEDPENPGNKITITATGFIDIYPDRVFIPKYYYYNETIGTNVDYTPTNRQITYFYNDYYVVNNEVYYPALSTTTDILDTQNIYVLESESLIDNKNTITWKSASEVKIDEYKYFNGFKITYESSLLKSGATLDNISCQRIITYQLDKTETINGQRYYRYRGTSEQAIIKNQDNKTIPQSLLPKGTQISDFFIFGYVPYDYVYCKNYKFFSELNSQLNISVTAPTTEPGKPPILPANPLFIKNTSGESVAMTELYWEYTSSGIGKHCNNITLSYESDTSDILTEKIEDFVYFNTTDQVSIRKIKETYETDEPAETIVIVKYVIISKQYSQSYFKDCKLNTWELKYCFSNDTDRFDWADSENGKGVIYYMKDEWGNECPYDFKNIKFNNKFTFSSGDSTDMSLYGLASQNIIKPYLFTNIKYRLNDITFRTNGNVIGNTFGPNCYNCHFDDTLSTTDLGYLFNEFKGGNNGITDEDVNI